MQLSAKKKYALMKDLSKDFSLVRMASAFKVHEKKSRRYFTGSYKLRIFQKAELLATAPNQVWSWDITKLKSITKWAYFYLYVITDIFSRYVVGLMVANREKTDLAKRLIQEICQKQRIMPDQLGLHADRGPSMKSKGIAYFLVDLGVTKT